MLCRLICTFRLISVVCMGMSMFLGGGGLTDPRPRQSRVTLCIKHGHIMWRGRAVMLHYLKLYQVMSRWMNPFIRATNTHYSAVIKSEGSGWEVPRLTGEPSGTWSPLICPMEPLIPLVGAPGCSSSLPTAQWQISVLAFEVGVDLKGLIWLPGGFTVAAAALAHCCLYH